MYKRGTKVIDLGDLIKLPKSIKIGDVMLLENLNEENEFRYVRDFDNLDWKGLISLRDVSGEEGKYKSLKVVYGDSRDLRNLLSEGRCPNDIEYKATKIAIDTATMRISIDDRTEDFDTGSDGFLGTVFEFSKLDELKGIVIDLVLDTISRGSLDTIKEQIEKVFNCSLS